MPLIISIVYGLLILGQIVIFFYVLFRLLKEKGILHAILGFFCSIYTFIWGWVRHKDLELTKVMLVWSVMIVVGIVLNTLFAGVMVAQFAQMVPGLQQEIQREMASQPQATPAPAPATRTPVQKPTASGARTTVQQPQATAPGKNADWHAKAKALVKNGQYAQPEQAVMYLSNAIQVNPRSAEVHNDRGLAYLQMNKLPQALQDFNQAIRLDSRFAEAFNNRGRVHYDMGNWNAALKDFGQAIVLKGNYAKAYMGRGLAHYQMKQNGPACSDFNRACQLGECDAMKWSKTANVCH